MKKSTSAENVQICEKYRTAVELSGKLLTQIASDADISYRTLYSVMKGIGQPTGRTLFKIARALGTTPFEIMSGRYDGKNRLVNAVHDIRVQWGPDAVKPGHTVLTTAGSPTPVPARMTELIRQLADAIGVSDDVVIDHVQQMKTKVREGSQS